MKISKLFHWLYAILMLLPICGVFFKVGYVMLNENAYQSYSGQYSYNSNLSLKQYYPNINDRDTWNTTSLSDWVYYNNFYSSFVLYTDNSQTDLGQTWYSIDVNSFSDNIKSQLTNNDLSTINSLLIFGNSSSYNLSFFAFDLDNLDHNPSWDSPYKRINNVTDNISFDLSDTKIYARTQYATSSNIFQFLFSTSYVIDTTLSSVFYSSLQELDNTEFFSWAKDSFLVTPIMYIGNLFGITSPHPIFTLMSYWLAISIIWLVFDLVMYLPLLVHRWLDKGVIE